jgi:hypothetical protein
LFALTIFQCAGLLAPKGILEKISKTLRGFLWEGGKTNTKKFHLVNWITVCQPSGKGGLVVRNPSLMNISLGEKLVWHLISGSLDWWKQAILVKYIG